MDCTQAKGKAMQTAVTEGEKIRIDLATRMREAVYTELTREDGRVVEKIFDGKGDLQVLLGAIADLSEALIVKAAESAGGCGWRGMVDEVSGGPRRHALCDRGRLDDHDGDQRSGLHRRQQRCRA